MRPPRPGTKSALRIGDTEREGAVSDLGRHFADGRLTPPRARGAHRARPRGPDRRRSRRAVRRSSAALPTPDVPHRLWPAQALKIAWRLAAVALVAALLLGALHVVQVILVVTLVALALRLSIGRRGGGRWHPAAQPSRRPW